MKGDLTFLPLWWSKRELKAHIWVADQCQRKGGNHLDSAVAKPACGKKEEVNPFLCFLTERWLPVQPQPRSNSAVLEPDEDQTDTQSERSAYPEPECIIGSTDRQGELVFLIKWYLLPLFCSFLKLSGQMFLLL